MYQNAENIKSYYENQIRELQDLFLQYRNYMQGLESQIKIKDRQISSLQSEISQLKSQFGQTPSNPYNNPPQVRSRTIESSPLQNTYANQSNLSSPQMVTIDDYNNGARVNKRKCPICGAMGFAIKEFEDKTRIISYIPRRIYAMKKVCTKCFNEF